MFVYLEYDGDLGSLFKLGLTDESFVISHTSIKKNSKKKNTVLACQLPFFALCDCKLKIFGLLESDKKQIDDNTFRFRSFQ